GCFGTQQVRFGAAQQQRGTSHRVPYRPEVGLRRRSTKRNGDARVVLEPPLSVGRLPCTRARELGPLRIAQHSERRRHLANVRLQRIESVEYGIESDVSGDARERGGL